MENDAAMDWVGGTEKAIAERIKAALESTGNDHRDHDERVAAAQLLCDLTAGDTGALSVCIWAEEWGLYGTAVAAVRRAMDVDRGRGWVSPAGRRNHLEKLLHRLKAGADGGEPDEKPGKKRKGKKKKRGEAQEKG